MPWCSMSVNVGWSIRYHPKLASGLSPLPCHIVDDLFRHSLDMLGLINEVRTAAEVPLLEMGVNIALQPHAEAQLHTCTTSYWSEEGLKDYMRYSLSGGINSSIRLACM